MLAHLKIWLKTQIKKKCWTTIGQMGFAQRYSEFWSQMTTFSSTQPLETSSKQVPILLDLAFASNVRYLDDHEMYLSSIELYKTLPYARWQEEEMYVICDNHQSFEAETRWQSGMCAPPHPAPRKKGCPAPQKSKSCPAPRKLANPAGRGGAKLIWIPWKSESTTPAKSIPSMINNMLF